MSEDPWRRITDEDHDEPNGYYISFGSEEVSLWDMPWQRPEEDDTGYPYDEDPRYGFDVNSIYPYPEEDPVEEYERELMREEEEKAELEYLAEEVDGMGSDFDHNDQFSHFDDDDPVNVVDRQHVWEYGRQGAIYTPEPNMESGKSLVERYREEREAKLRRQQQS